MGRFSCLPRGVKERGKRVRDDAIKEAEGIIMPLLASRVKEDHEPRNPHDL